MDHPDLLLLVRITIFTLMLDVGITLPFGQLTSLWRRPALLIRSLAVRAGAGPRRGPAPALAARPAARGRDGPRRPGGGARRSPHHHAFADGWREHALSASLQLTLALLAVLTTPLTLAIFHAMFVLETSGLPSVEVAREVAIVQFLPVSIGLLVRRLVPGLAAIAAKPLTVLANVLFALLFAAIVTPGIRMILHFGTLPALAVVIMVGISLAIGHLLGGPTPDERAALAISSIARNVGLALFITALNSVEQTVLPTLLSYMILGAIVAVPYSAWSKRRVARQRDDRRGES